MERLKHERDEVTCCVLSVWKVKTTKVGAQLNPARALALKAPSVSMAVWVCIGKIEDSRIEKIVM
jgi:hypothetical protein